MNHRNKEGLLHRVNGVACFNKEFKQYFRNDERHRENGPSLIYCYGDDFGFSSWVFYNTYTDSFSPNKKIYG